MTFVKQHRNTMPHIIYMVTIFVLFSVFSLQAQQDAQYTQYMYNTVSVNPGYAGSRGHLSVAALHRSQWVGLDGAPTTQTFNIHSPIGYRGIGLGLSVVNDQIGPTSETNFDVDFSYTLYLSTEGRLSFGLKAGGNLLDVKFSELNQFTTLQILVQGFIITMKISMLDYLYRDFYKRLILTNQPYQKLENK